MVVGQRTQTKTGREIKGGENGRDKKIYKKKITQASRPAATKGGGGGGCGAHGPIRKMLLSAGSGASPRLTATFCLFFFSLNGLGYTCKSSLFVLHAILFPFCRQQSVGICAAFKPAN